MFAEDFAPLIPVNFFAMGLDCHHVDSKSALTKRHLLPEAASLCDDQEPFADVAMGWNDEGLMVQVSVRGTFGTPVFPSVHEGDSIELFFDTRDVKGAGFNHRFCHHFYVLPEAVNGLMAGEITRFRTEDAHELCDPKDLKAHCKETKKGCEVNLSIPAHCLHGYEPEQFDRIGFTYRINRQGATPQHLAVSSVDYAIDQNPSLWSSVKLVR